MGDTRQPFPHGSSKTARAISPDTAEGRAIIQGDASALDANKHANPSVERAQHPERLSPELLNVISHELRSPLAAIKGYAATLRRHEKRLSGAERKEFLDAIDQASDHLTLIVGRILELSQLELGLVTLAHEPISLARVVREAVAAAERRLASAVDEHQRCVFVISQHPETLAVANGLVLGDARYLRDVIDNLIENAIKYSPVGGVIEIALAPGHLGADALRPAIQLTVRDEGIGIADEHLGRIFETFQRVDNQATRTTEGLGLGLAICKEIVARLDGELSAESSPGHGASFRVVLPRADDATAHEE